MAEYMLQALEGAGPYMGTAILMAILQFGIILKIANKAFRVRALYATGGLQVIALAAGLIVQFLKDI